MAGSGDDGRRKPQERDLPPELEGEVAETDDRRDDNTGYLYRPGELFVPRDSLETDSVTRAIKRFELSLDDEETGDLALLRMPDGSPDARRVPEIVDVLRNEPGDDDRTAQVGPNHVLFGATHRIFGPADPPVPGTPWGHLPKSGPGEGVTIAVLDTGVTDHPIFGGRVTVTSANDEHLHNPLALQDGHGTFIAGVILRHAPGAEVRAVRLLSSHGHIDDRSIAAAVRANADATILSLSFGGYTLDNAGLFAFPAALADAWSQNPDLVVVAAAGNGATDRPFYPAAYPGVVGVAALNARRELAWFSNYGSWVTASAPGEDVDGPFVSLTGAKGPVPWARWSGTSFAAPYVAASIAARVTSRTSASLAWHLQSMRPARPDVGVQITTRSFSVP